MLLFLIKSNIYTGRWLNEVSWTTIDIIKKKTAIIYHETTKTGHPGGLRGEAVINSGSVELELPATALKNQGDFLS